jgi:Methyltransferase domain
MSSEPQSVMAWLAALDERHLANLTPSEVGRALRALSSCYVERRARLGEGGPLATAGKRAAFALFYAPVHFFIVREVVRALRMPGGILREIYDLGCGTGSAGAAWALERAGASVSGTDRHPWAVAEANWTYRQLGVPGRAVQQDVQRVRFVPSETTGILAAYSVNELTDAAREALLPRLLDARTKGATVLIVEPIARRLTPWWRHWETAFQEHGGRADEWRFPASLPQRQRGLAKAAGLNPQALTARSLSIGPGHGAEEDAS